MLPLVSASNNIPVQLTLVATPLPETTALRAPADNVAPSGSSVQLQNNASGKQSVSAAEETQATVSSDAAVGESADPFSASLGIGAPATVLAQLLSEEVPPQAQSPLSGLLVEYEKLIAFSYVKYKPSNASLPPPAPSSLFNNILKEDVAAPVQAPPPQPAALVASTAPSVAVTAAAEEEAPTVSPAQEFAPQENESSDRIITLASPSPLPVAFRAYAAAASRPVIATKPSLAESNAAA